ncbi:MAG: TetR family transcriptional regulator [Glaciihabitans sp.]|nr:TetR family transcriptional regulator [Glaciihabitans sp.]
MSKPFHHGNLRAALLTQAEVVLRHSGVDGLSLRELAREIGVSHGAPRSHFIDRTALLDALAERGFDRLTERVQSALATEGTLEVRFHTLGHAYVDFAIDEAALMELMFAAKMNDTTGAVQQAAGRLFGTLSDSLEGTAEDGVDDEALMRFKLLFAATMQGTATLVASGRIPRKQGEVVVDDAIDLLLGSELGRRVLSRD